MPVLNDSSSSADIDREKYYQTVFYLIFLLIGLKVEAEVKTNKGGYMLLFSIKTSTILKKIRIWEER